MERMVVGGAINNRLQGWQFHYCFLCDRKTTRELTADDHPLHIREAYVDLGV